LTETGLVGYNRPVNPSAHGLRLRRLALSTGLALVGCSALAGGAAATDYKVTTTADLPGNCAATPASCSLRQAITAAGAGPNADTIALPAGIFALPNGTLTLNLTTVTISGAGPSATRITGSDTVQVLNLPDPGSNLTLRGLAIVNGRVTGDGGAIFLAANSTLTAQSTSFEANQASNRGGAVNFAGGGTGRYTDVTFTDSVASGSGGGGIFMNFPSNSTYTRATFLRNKTPAGSGGAIELFSPNNSSLTDVIFEGNEASSRGGAMMFNSAPGNPAVTTFTRVTARNNKSGTTGGAVHFNNSPQPQFIDSTFSGNTAGQAGGAIKFGTNALVSFVNATLSGNSTTAGADGGALHFDTGANATLRNATLAGNSAADAGGAISVTNPVTVTLVNSLLAGNTAVGGGANCGAALTSGGGNLESADTCGLAAGEKRNTNPLLAALADNGGPTQTRALAPGSPARNAAIAGACPGTDQRGVLRAPGPCDIGAFELAPPVAVTGAVTALTSRSATLNGTVRPNQRVAATTFQFGRTTAYGRTTAQAQIGRGGSTVPVSSAITRLAQDTTYHYRAVATTTDGSSLGADRIFRTRNRRPVVSGFRMTRRLFAVKSATAAALKRGSAFRFRLSEKATVRITISRCRKRNRRGRCTRYRRVGSIRRKAKSGRNRVNFKGKLRGRKLAPGRYRATIVAADRRKSRSKARKVTFRIAAP
jgi:CSLREA domain-containing protein